jgi:hypothetical protein
MLRVGASFSRLCDVTAASVRPVDTEGSDQARLRITVLIIAWNTLWLQFSNIQAATVSGVDYRDQNMLKLINVQS